MAGRQVRRLAHAAREQKSLGSRLHVRDPGGDRLAGLVGQLGLHRLLGLVLLDDGTMGDGAAVGDVSAFAEEAGWSPATTRRCSSGDPLRSIFSDWARSAISLRLGR